jgi:putative flippase GtrA
VSPLAVRWVKFNFVGGIGIVVQLAMLALLAQVFHVPYLPATALAVESAILHNFAWHERFTWKERAGAGRLARLARFHAGNGAISIVGNLVLMRLLVGGLHMRVLVANVLTIAVCSIANFGVGEWFVFRVDGPRKNSRRRRNQSMQAPIHRRDAETQRKRGGRLKRVLGLGAGKSVVTVDGVFGFMKSRAEGAERAEEKNHP